MNEFVLNIVISDSGNILAMFIAFLLLCHLLVYPKNLSKKAWKKVDYIWLGAAVIGLLSLASDVRIFAANNWAEIEKYRAASSIELLRSFYSSPEGSYLCMKYSRSKYSPDDFDERQRQQNLLCNWAKEVASVLKKLDPKELPSLSMDDFPIPAFKQADLIETVKDVEKRVAWYNENRERALKTKALTSKSDMENSLFYLSPFIICLALALRIAKVTGELKHEKT